VGPRLTYLVTGSDAGPSKLEKAQKLGIQVVNEAFILELLGKSPLPL
jgi:DNA ligase (NAD+)